MLLSITTTATNPYERMDMYDEAIACYNDLADEVIVTGEDWPHEFKWDYIGQEFTKGYDLASGDWVMRMDLDYIVHEDDMEAVRRVLQTNPDAPAIAFLKWQFLKADRYNVKARLLVAVNKKKYGKRIRLDGGGDLCQPTLDGVLIKTDGVPQAGIPIYNYDFTLKTKQVVAKDFARFARAWRRQFGNTPMGNGSQDEAMVKFEEMMRGRWAARQWAKLDIGDHPKYVQDTLRNLKAENFGFNGWGWFDV